MEDCMSTEAELESTIKGMVQKGKGILAADESTPTIAKRFVPHGIEQSEEMRRAYRTLLFTAPGIEEHISAVILFEETLSQSDDKGTPLAEILSDRGIIPGIKVDKGKIALANSPGDEITQGIDGLSERLRQYKPKGARFAKWRAVFSIAHCNPGRLGIETNAEMLARYAAVCQQEGIVPIVEPEVLMDGEHGIERCSAVSEKVWHEVFHALHRHKVILELMVLKPGMILPGKSCAEKASAEEVAHATVRVLRRTVPAAVPGINFLSGGLSPLEATANLNAMNALYPGLPWELSFSYGRALQQTVLEAWKGRRENIAAAQGELYRRAKMNGLARYGKYHPEME